MAVPFPQRFDLDAFQGAWRLAYQKREDAFQQLIGNGLQEVYGPRTFVAPTLGRDGSIDAAVDPGANPEERFLEVLSPFIVECKDHDEAGADLRKNILKGWATVEKKLREQATAGWPDRFAPWKKARGYLYCISARLSTKDLRDELEQRIRAFFESLPVAQRPPLEKIQVLGWNELRAWLDGLPRLADRWLGASLPSIVDHASFIAGLDGFRRYLLPQHLAYVPPPPHHPVHPDRLLERLGTEGLAPGVLVLGRGGAGKTRALVEVSHRADAAGWRVLHVRPGDPAVTNQDLADHVLLGVGRTLVVFDYIDQLIGLDWAAIQHRLVPDAKGRGIRLAFLASTRPRVEGAPMGISNALFETRELSPDEQWSLEIVRAIEKTLAPEAAKVIGAERVRNLCGQRPIIAMFIASELERRVQLGTLTPDVLQDVRSADLMSWLRRRLSEGQLLAPPRKGLLPPQIEPALVGAAAVFSVVPLNKGRCRNAALAALQAAEPGADEEHAEQLLAVLGELGWIELRGPELEAAHDSVADEVLEQVLWAPPAGLRTQTLSHVLVL